MILDPGSAFVGLHQLAFSLQYLNILPLYPLHHFVRPGVGRFCGSQHFEALGWCQVTLYKVTLPCAENVLCYRVTLNLNYYHS